MRLENRRRGEGGARSQFLHDVLICAGHALLTRQQPRANHRARQGKLAGGEGELSASLLMESAVIGPPPLLRILAPYWLLVKHTQAS